MRYKVLLAGHNRIMIDDMFSHLDEQMELLSTSMRLNDIMGHIQYFEPDLFCLCTNNEAKDYIAQMKSVKKRLQDTNTPFVMIGSDGECAEFEKDAPGIADMVLKKPLTVSMIKDKIMNYLDDLHYEEQLRIEEELRLAEVTAEVAAEEAAKEAAKNIRRHILIIDDDSTMLKAIKEQLHKQYDIATALSGKIAMKFLEKRTTDLILLDYEMPTETGPMVLEKIRGNETTKDIPVIFLTGVTDRDKITQVLALKPQGYLLKPIEHDKLIFAIEKALAGEHNI